MKKSNLDKVLKLIDQLSQEELTVLRCKLDSAKELTWSTVNLEDPSERTALFAKEEAKAGERVKEAFANLQSKGILDEEGNLITGRIPNDMEPGSASDVGG